MEAVHLGSYSCHLASWEVLGGHQTSFAVAKRYEINSKYKNPVFVKFIMIQLSKSSTSETTFENIATFLNSLIAAFHKMCLACSAFTNRS